MFARRSSQSRRRSRPAKARGAAVACALAVASLAAADPAAATNPFGPDFHSNCTAGFAVGSTVEGSPGAVGTVAMPPKQFGSLSDVGYYSRTNCG